MLGVECSVCHNRWFPNIKFGCERCGAYGDDLADREFDGIGRILSCVNVTEGESSFILAMIELEEGPVLGGIIDGTDLPSIGDRITAFGTQVDGEELIRFRRSDG